jgi:hypothetical protein
MKYTLLEMTQEILSSMDSDEVTSITDTAEALQVARIIRQAYYELMNSVDPPELYKVFELTTTSADTPTQLILPDDINSLVWVKYDCHRLNEGGTQFEMIPFRKLEDFLATMHLLDTQESDVVSFNVTIDGDVIPVYCNNSRAPSCYTCLGDDQTIIFDSFDSSVEDFLSGTKTMCYGKETSQFFLTDAFIPKMDEPLFTVLLNEAKVLAFAELKSVNHTVADRNARRGRNRTQAEKFRIKRESAFFDLPHFGRK